MKIFLLFLYLFLFIINCSFIPNSNKIIFSEQQNYNSILEIQKIPCFSQSVRVKTFNSALIKMNKYSIKTIYEVNDLIAFRFVFYNKYDLLKFYYHLYNEKKIVNYHNEIYDNFNNSYSAIILRYQNEYSDCPLYQIECQIFCIKDYFEYLINNAKINQKKNTCFPYN